MAMSSSYVRGICLGLGLAVAGITPSLGTEPQGKLSPSELERKNAAHYMHKAQHEIEALNCLEQDAHFVASVSDVMNNGALSLNQRVNKILPLIDQALQGKSGANTIRDIRASILVVIAQNPQIGAEGLFEKVRAELTQEIERYQAMIPHNQ